MIGYAAERHRAVTKFLVSFLNVKLFAIRQFFRNRQHRCLSASEHDMRAITSVSPAETVRPAPSDILLRQLLISISIGFIWSTFDGSLKPTSCAMPQHPSFYPD